MTAHEYEFLPELAAHEMGAHEYEYESEAEAVAPSAAAAMARAALAAVAGESETEAELNPVRRWYADAMLEHLAHEAAAAESEGEAGEAFLPLIPLIAAKLLPLAAKAAPLIAKAMPKVMQVVSRVTPQLTRGVVNVARTMFRTPATRRLLRAVPTIAQRTIGQIARQVASGRPVTAQSAVRTLAGQTAVVLRQPARFRRVVRRSQALDSRFHQVMPGVSAGPGPAGVSSSSYGAAVPGPGRPVGVVTGRGGCPRCGCRCGGCGGCGCR